LLSTRISSPAGENCSVAALAGRLSRSPRESVAATASRDELLPCEAMNSLSNRSKRTVYLRLEVVFLVVIFKSKAF